MLGRVSGVDPKEYFSFDLTDMEIAKLAGVPDGVTFDKANLPHYYVDSRTEDNMTVYIAPGGKKYHRTYGCCGATNEIHLFSIADLDEPCHNCVPYKALNYTNPPWYYRYLQLLAKREASRSYTKKQIAGSVASTTSADRRNA